MTIVCNTSPLSNLAAIDRLFLVREVYERIVIPEAVANEIAKVGTIYSQASLIRSQDWITIYSVNNESDIQRLQEKKLDLGEAEAIALAIELNADLWLVDEQLGRRVALDEGLNITGLLGVLLEAKKKGAIGEIKPIVDDLRSKAVKPSLESLQFCIWRFYG